MKRPDISYIVNRLVLQHHDWMLEMSEESNVFYISKDSPNNGDSLLCLTPGVNDKQIEKLLVLFEAERFLYTIDFDSSILVLTDFPGEAKGMRRLITYTFPKDKVSLVQLVNKT